MEARIVKIIDSHKVAINKGSLDGVKVGDIFIVFKKDDEIFDPDTNESLGILEIPKFRMKAVSTQDRLSILDSNEIEIVKPSIKKTIVKTSDIYNRNAHSMSHVLRAIHDGQKEHIEEKTETSEPENKKVGIKERGITEKDFSRKINWL